MRQTARQCPFYISFIEKHSQIKIVEKWVDTAQRGSTIQMGVNKRFFHAAYFTIHSCQFESRALQYTRKSCQSIFAIWEIVGSCLKERALMCEPHNSAAWGRCLVKHNCCYPPVAEWDSSVLYFEDCKFSTFPSSRCWRVVHCGRASLGGNHLVNQAAACRSPGARAAHPSQTLSASLSHSRWTFHQFGKNMQKPITLSTPIFHPAIFSQKSEEKKTGQIGRNSREQQIYPKVLDLRHCLLNTIILF